jgi:hypothetical protein
VCVRVCACVCACVCVRVRVLMEEKEDKGRVMCGVQFHLKVAQLQ